MTLFEVSNYTLWAHVLNNWLLFSSSAKTSNSPLAQVEQLKEELRAKKMLFPKSQLQLSKVVGQGKEETTSGQCKTMH